MSNVIPKADKQQIYAHNVVLTSQSASFKAMFQVRSYLQANGILNHGQHYTRIVKTKRQLCMVATDGNAGRRKVSGQGPPNHGTRPRQWLLHVQGPSRYHKTHADATLHCC